MGHGTLCQGVSKPSFLPCDHTGENVAEALLSALASWDLKAESQVCLTTDNGSNVINAAQCLGWLQLSCFGHNLHLAITKSLKDERRCTRALGVSRKIVSTFSASWKKKRELTKAQITLGLKQHALVAVSIVLKIVILKLCTYVCIVCMYVCSTYVHVCMYHYIHGFSLQDCPTRWGSTAKMVSRILEQEESIRIVLSADRKTSHLVPTWQDRY